MSVEMTQYPNVVFETYYTFQPVVTIFPMIPMPCWFQGDILIETEAEVRPNFYSDSHVTMDELIAKAAVGPFEEVNRSELIIFNSYGVLGLSSGSAEPRRMHDYGVYKAPEKTADGEGLILKSKRQYGMRHPDSYWSLGGLHIYHGVDVFTENQITSSIKSPQVLLDSLSWKLRVSRVTVKAELLPYEQPL